MCTSLNAELESNHTPDNLSELIINLSPEHFSNLQKLGLSITFPFFVFLYNMFVLVMSVLVFFLLQYFVVKAVHSGA